ncbi:hypothetical protein [Actimicrobium antarcticum]|uniref:Uncharacterized protein n=1 Tax=Actimicrobium antarcticum TaxID=1051899 RepID=A0ABP7T184_9BURK
MKQLLPILCAACLCACQPAVPPPDPIARQRAVLDKAKAVEGLLQQQNDQRMKALEEAR